MTHTPLYNVIATVGGWYVLSTREGEAEQWRVRFDTRQEAVELADHLEYEPGDSPIGKPDHYERLPDVTGIPTYRHTRKF